MKSKILDIRKVHFIWTRLALNKKITFSSVTGIHEYSIAGIGVEGESIRYLDERNFYSYIDNLKWKTKPEFNTSYWKK
jgi:hypothetical protein